MDAALLVAADVLFLLEQPSKFKRENCIIVRQMDVVVLDAWRQLASDVDTVDSRRGQHSPCGGGRSLTPWATSLSMVTVGVVELLFLLALACQ